MQHDEHVWARYRYYRDGYMTKAIATPEFARLIWWQISGWPPGAPGR